MRESRLPTPSDVIRWLTAFALTIVGGVTLIGNRIHAAGNDAVFTQSLVNRAARFGGTYYQNGITPKGPLEDVAHDIALRVGGYDGHWYVISVMVAISAALIGLAAARTALTTGGNRYVALAVATVVFVHFTLSDAAYAGLLYSRNILVTLFAVAWYLVLDDRGWVASPRVQTAVAAAVGALVGLGVQTILPSFVDATAITLAAIVLVSRVDEPARRFRLRIAIVATAAVAFVSAPVWYLLRGSFAEFWASWWTYASYQSAGIGLSLAQQLSRGWHTAYAYYQHRPLLFLLLFAFGAVTVAQWPDFDRKVRVVHVGLFGWLAGGWFQLVTGERYSTHYFSVIAAPTAMIGAALAGHAFVALASSPRITRTAVAWPLIALLGSFYLSAGTAARLVDAASTTSGFTSVQRGVQLTRDNQPGPNRSVQAVLDLVSRDRDPLLVYSDNQFVYPDYRRVPASRFQQRYFLIGSIYLGETSSRFVLHDTWKWFRQDMRETNPAAYFQIATENVDSKEFADYLSAHFEKAFRGSAGMVELRNDVADSVLRGSAGKQWSAPSAPAPGSGWHVDGSSVTYAKSPSAPADDHLVLAAQSCERVQGTLTGTGAAPALAFHVLDPSGHQGEVKLVLDSSGATSETSDGNVFETLPVAALAPDGSAAPRPVPFTLVMGRRAAALVIGGTIVAAVELPQHTEITVDSPQSQVSITDLHVGAPPIGSGC